MVVAGQQKHFGRLVEVVCIVVLIVGRIVADGRWVHEASDWDRHFVGWVVRLEFQLDS